MVRPSIYNKAIKTADIFDSSAEYKHYSCCNQRGWMERISKRVFNWADTSYQFAEYHNHQPSLVGTAGVKKIAFKRTLLNALLNIINNDYYKPLGGYEHVVI